MEARAEHPALWFVHPPGVPRDVSRMGPEAEARSGTKTGSPVGRRSRPVPAAEAPVQDA